MVITAIEIELSKVANPRLGYGDVIREVEARGGATLANIRDAICSIRRSKLPDTAVLGNAGSFFKNPVISVGHFARIEAAAKAEFGADYKVPHYDLPAGMVKVPAAWMIEQCGWKETPHKHVGVYRHQALVVVNLGGATGKEVLDFASAVVASVKDKFGVHLNMEVNVIG